MLTQQTTNTWRNLAHPSDASPSRSRRSVFFSKQQRAKSSAGLAMKYKCSSASLCSQKRHTRWHVSWPLRSEALRAVSSPAVRIAACVPLSPTVTPRAEKPHERSLPSLPRRHIRQLRGIRWVGAPPSSIRPGSLPLSHFRMNPIRIEIATLIEQLQVLTAKQFILRAPHVRPLTVVVQDFQDGNGISNGEMPSKSEPHGRTFCQVLQKASRFLWRPTGSIKAFLRRLKGASMPETHVDAPRSSAPFPGVDGCRQLLIRHAKSKMRSEKTHRSNRCDGEATGVLRRWER